MEISKALPERTARSSFAQLRTPQRKAVNPKTHFCPRCKQDRMNEWFGDPKAPYAICLSCRVEVNGEKKKVAAEIKTRRVNCVICMRLLDEHDQEICIKCEAGVNYFERSHKLLARAAAYLVGNLRKPKRKEHRRKHRIRSGEIRRLIQQQAQDDRERNLRFEHSVSKP